MNAFEKYLKLHKELSELNADIENAINTWIAAHAEEINPEDPDAVMFNNYWTIMNDGIMIDLVIVDDYKNRYEEVTVKPEEILKYFEEN